MAKSAPISHRTSGDPPPRGRCTPQSGAGRMSRDFEAAPQGKPRPVDGWGDKKSFRDVRIITGGIKANPGKPSFCKNKGNNFRPRLPASHSMNPRGGELALGQPPGLTALPGHAQHRHLDPVSLPATQCLTLDGFMCPTAMPPPFPPFARLGSKANAGEAAPCSP